MAEKKSVFVHGGDPASVIQESNKPVNEVERAQDTARRYRCEFVDLKEFQLQHDLFKKVPVDLMFRYNFIPLEETRDGKLAIAIADPSQLMMIDEISLLLGKRIVTKVSTLKQITDILKRYREAGLTMPLLWPPFADVPVSKTLDDMKRLKEEIMPKVEAV